MGGEFVARVILVSDLVGREFLHIEEVSEHILPLLAAYVYRTAAAFGSDNAVRTIDLGENRLIALQSAVYGFGSIAYHRLLVEVVGAGAAAEECGKCGDDDIYLFHY